MKISQVVSKIPGSPTLALTAKVKQLRAQGKQCHRFWCRGA
ncbi:MAG: hypothetical protein ACOX3E_04385 [Desulfomonilia bacterium]